MQELNFFFFKRIKFLRHIQKRKRENNDRKAMNKEMSGLENNWINKRWGINALKESSYFR